MRPLAFAACLCLLGVLDAQTFVVDAGGGGNFTEVRDAVGAVPSGSVLRVRAGTYVPFTLSNKTLTIIGDSAATVFIRPPLQESMVIGPTAANQTVVLKNLWFQGGLELQPMTMQLTGLAGPTWLEDLTLGWPAGSAILGGVHATVIDCANVHWLRCTCVALHTGSPPPPELSLLRSSVELVQCTVRAQDWDLIGPPGGTAIHVTSSRLTMVSCVATGGRGAWIFGQPRAFPGGPALSLAAGSALHAYGNGTLLTGGAGGTFLNVPGGDGAAGLDLASSTATLIGATPIGGAAGLGPPPGQPGRPIVADAGSSVRSITATGPSLIASGNLTRGGMATIDLTGGAGDWATLLIGQTPAFVPAPSWITAGTLFVDPLVVLGARQVPAGGVLSIPLQLPSDLPLDQLFLFQHAVLPRARSEIWMSNSTSILVKS